MIVYDYRSGYGLSLMLHSSGSALFNFRTVLPALLSAIVGFVVSYVDSVNAFLQTWLQNPAVYFNGVAFLISFVVVFRSQLAYNRFFGALTSYFRMKARLLNLVYLTKSLALSNSPQAIKTKATIIRWARLYHKLAITQLRGGYVQDIDIKNLVQHRELEILVASRTRTQLVTSWIMRGLAENMSQFGAPPPIIGRLFVLLGDVELEFAGALQVATTPFPFPYAQITVVLLYIWLFTTPLFVSRWVQEAPFLTAGLSFVSTWIIFSVNEAAANIEDPMDGDDNDFPLTYFDVVFDNAIDGAQFAPDPSFLSESRCYEGAYGQYRQDRMAWQVDKMAATVDDGDFTTVDIQIDENARDRLESADAERRSTFSDSSSLNPSFTPRSLLKKARSSFKPNSSRTHEDKMSEASHFVNVVPSGGHTKQSSSEFELKDSLGPLKVLDPLPTQSDEPMPPMDTSVEDSEFAPESSVLLLFALKTNSAIVVEGRIRRLLSRWRETFRKYTQKTPRTLRELYNERVDSSTMRAQGKFEKYS